MTHNLALTHSSTFRPSFKTSLPSKALNSYLQAAETSAPAVTDEVTLSTAAQGHRPQTKGLLKAASVLGLGVALMGVFGVGNAAAAEPVKQPVQHESVDQFQRAGREVREVGLELGRQGKEVGKEAAKVGKQVGKEAAKVGKDVGKEAKKVGKEIGKAGKEVGKEAAKVGKEIGRQGAEIGKDVGKAAKSFWKGLTGN